MGKDLLLFFIQTKFKSCLQTVCFHISDENIFREHI